MSRATSRLTMRAASVLAVCATAALVLATSSAAAAPFPRYDHVFLVIDENHDFNQIIGNPDAPDINALADEYGLATSYTGVGDPSEPNYVAMLGGSTFGINSDDPYFFPGHTVDEPNLMSQLEAAGLSWKGYFQGMPYAGYRGYCFPAKCNGIPDSDTQYVAKHNGIVNFANMQGAAQFARQVPYPQLAGDLAAGRAPSLSYIVPDECHDMHGAPPWCLDSGRPGSLEDDWLVATGDAFVGRTVQEITSSPVWASGNDAIVITFDEGNAARDRVATVVVTNHGRHVLDATPHDHYSLLASLQRAFGLGCLLGSCTATPMTRLFEPSGTRALPTLPPPVEPPPDGSNSVSATGPPLHGRPATLTTGESWQVVPSAALSTFDNNLAAVSAASPSDAWAVGDYYPSERRTVLENLGEHWDGTRWTAYALPDVGPNGNTLFGVSQLPGGEAWAVGYYVDAEYAQRTLVEHWDGTSWEVFPSPDPGAGNVLYGVRALSATDAWAVGGEQDAGGVWHTLVEHWDGTRWSVAPSADPDGGGNLLYAVAGGGEGLYAAGQSGTAFPSRALVEQFDHGTWRALAEPKAQAESLDPFGLATSGETATVVGARESDTTPFTTLVASGPPSALALLTTPSAGSGENDLFAAATAPDGSTWADGWYIEPASGLHRTLIEHGVAGAWSLVPSPSPGKEEDGLAGIAAVPGGGTWAVGITTNSAGNPAPLVEYRG